MNKNGKRRKGLTDRMGREVVGSNIAIAQKRVNHRRSSGYFIG
jgi:hypothetical protein